MGGVVEFRYDKLQKKWSNNIFTTIAWRKTSQNEFLQICEFTHIDFDGHQFSLILPRIGYQ